MSKKNIILHNEFLLLHRYFPCPYAENNRRCRNDLDDVSNFLVAFFENAILSGQEEGSKRDLPARETALILISTVDGIARRVNFRLNNTRARYHERFGCCHCFLQSRQTGWRENTAIPVT